MSYITPNLGLTAWDQGVDPYDHSQLANNWARVDQHDHSPGKGIQVPTEGLRNLSVTTDKIQNYSVTPAKIPDDSITEQKLAKDSVGTDEIIDLSVTTSKIADEAVTGPKLDPNLIPLGLILPWWRVSASVPLPEGWAIPDGRPWSSIPNDLGLSTGNMPDLRNRFVLGSSLVGTGSGLDTPPDVGSVGGRHSIALSHSHTVDAHSHLVNSHQHYISNDGTHLHRFWSKDYDTINNDPYLTHGNQRTVGVPTASGSRQAFYIPNLNFYGIESSNVEAPMESVGNHAHGGVTGGAAAGTSNSSPGTSSALSSNNDIRPGFIGLLYIMKVKI